MNILLRLINLPINLPIKLPTTIAVVYEGERSLQRLGIAFAVAGELMAWYRQRANIYIQPRRTYRIQPRWPESRAWVDEALMLHTVMGGLAPTLIIRSDFATLGKPPSGPYWGEAFPEVAAMVGMDANGAQHPYLAEIAIHEMGHLLGLQHEPDTFMDPDIRKLRDSPVLAAQRATMRRTAWRWGSL